MDQLEGTLISGIKAKYLIFTTRYQHPPVIFIPSFFMTLKQPNQTQTQGNLFKCHRYDRFWITRFTPEASLCRDTVDMSCMVNILTMQDKGKLCQTVYDWGQKGNCSRKSEKGKIKIQPPKRTLKDKVLCV